MNKVRGVRLPDELNELIAKEDPLGKMVFSRGLLFIINKHFKRKKDEKKKSK